MNACGWQSDVQHWILRLRSLPPTSGDSIALFFERTFQHTRYPQHAWFGVHSSAVSLVVGGIWLAAVMRSGQNKGVWLLVDREPPAIDGIEYRPVLSTQGSPSPLMWAHSSSLEVLPSLTASDTLWVSYSAASEKIFDSPCISSDRDAVQEKRKKRRLSDFWQVDSLVEIEQTYSEALYKKVLAGLIYEQDVRNKPDHLRRGQFKAGWEDVTLRGKIYVDSTLKRLTWHNLGYRFGKELGYRSAQEVYEVYAFLSQRYDVKGRKINSVHTVNAEAGIFPDEVNPIGIFREGAVCQVSVNAYERNPLARKKCIVHYGTSCFVCGFNFGKVFGELGKGFIHVHHLRPLSEMAEEHEVDPVEDLRPVCPNCHAMIHRRSPPLSIEEIKALLEHTQRLR